MIEIYFGIGIVLAILNLFMVHSKAFDKYGLEHYGKVAEQWKKMVYVLAYIPLWPALVMILMFARVKHD